MKEDSGHQQNWLKVENGERKLTWARSARMESLLWLVLPIALYFAFEALFFIAVPEGIDADYELLMHQAGLCILVIGFVAIAKLARFAGWTKAVSWKWILIAGPIWLTVFTPIPAALEFYRETPGKILPLLAVSLLVAINEETLFRGCMLNGLRLSLKPFMAALISSVAFGALHILNMGAGGDPVFVFAQMVAAAGTGTVLAAIALYARSILPVVFLHCVGDFVGLGALGGYKQAIQSPELAPSLIISGLIFMLWGLFWCWRFQRKEMSAKIASPSEDSKLAD